MSASAERPPLGRDEFIEWVRREGEDRYHDHHRSHRLMHDGKLTREQLSQWVLNRYYYQTRIPIKDAILLSKSEDPAFRRAWIRRIHDHDGLKEGEGGIAQWVRLGEGVGLRREEIVSLRNCARACGTKMIVLYFLTGPSSSCRPAGRLLPATPARRFMTETEKPRK